MPMVLPSLLVLYCGEKQREHGQPNQVSHHTRQPACLSHLRCCIKDAGNLNEARLMQINGFINVMSLDWCDYGQAEADWVLTSM